MRQIQERLVVNHAKATKKRGILLGVMHFQRFNTLSNIGEYISLGAIPALFDSHFFTDIGPIYKKK